MDWLQANGPNFGLTFSLMWFIDAFIEAHRNRVKASRKLDKQRLLLEKNANDDPAWWRGAWGVYYRTVALQLLLFPVLFFVFCYITASKLRNSEEDEVFLILHRTDDDDQIPDEYESFTTHANISLGFALLKHLAITVLRRTGFNLKRFGISRIKSGLKWLLLRAIHNPRQFRRRVLMVLRISRWVKYLAPLLGAINKLLGDVADLKKKFLQERAAVKARAIRRRLFDDFTPDELREHCAILIQKHSVHTRRESMCPH